MSEEIFNETIFINMVEEVRKKMEAQHGKTAWSKTAMGKAGGRKDGSAYDAWLKGREHLTVSNIVGLCAKVGWRPAWALFGEGPKNDEEAKKWDRLQNLIDKLSAIPALQLQPQATQSLAPHQQPPAHPLELPIGERHGSVDPTKPVDFGEESSHKPDEPDSDSKGEDSA